MTQARSSQAISLQLTPMQIPEAIPSSELILASSSSGEEVLVAGRPHLSLLLRPGEPSEMVVQIKNLGDRSLQLSLQVEGDFPAHWCRIGTEGSELLPGQQMDAVLYFQLPDDFFEQQEALLPGAVLKLDYHSRLCVSVREPDSDQQQVESAQFNLYIRSPSLYLSFLPEIYREVDFIGRFLKIFEQTFEPAVQTLDSLWAYLDPLTAPQALLPFLSHWVAWSFQPHLSLAQQRILIRHAMQIYSWRGTRKGLRFYLHLATGLPLDDPLPEAEKHISIRETFNRGFVMGLAQLGDDAILGGGRPYHFSVHLRSPDPTQLDESLIRRVIEQEKPAFCTYDLFLEPEPSSALLVPEESTAAPHSLNP